MSPYNDYETSPHDGGPLEGYHFIGPSRQYMYTNAQLPVTINGLFFEPKPIRRGEVRAGTHDDDSLELVIELPMDLQVVKDYAFSTSPPSLTLILYRYHQDSNPAADWVVSWQGKVSSFAAKDGIATVRIPAIFEQAIRGAVPTVFYQVQCNHVLYDARCKVVKSTFTKSTTVTVIDSSGTQITVTDDGFADNVHKAGDLFLRDKGEHRMILSNVSNVIVFDFPFFDIEVGDVVELSAGCNHVYQGDCKTKFANTLNFGGFPYIPNDNPFEGDLG